MRRFLLALAILALAAAPAAAGLFDQRKSQCISCHGANGVSVTPGIPSLGGEPELFALFQLVAFRDNRRNVPDMNEIMQGMSDDDLRAAAAFVAKLPPPPPPAEPGDATRMTRGKALSDQNRCGFCHNADFSGHDQIPRLAHQREDYLLVALRDYKSDKRFGTGAAMNEVVYPLSDADLVALAYYMAHVK